MKFLTNLLIFILTTSVDSQINTVVLNNTVEYTTVGCYKDADIRDLPYNTIWAWSTSMNYENCANHCSSNGYRYAGTQFQQNCHCGNSFGRYGPSTECNLPCAGNMAQICGNFDSSNVLDLNPQVPYKEIFVQGCYKDEESVRDLPYEKIDDDSMTYELCAQHCIDKGYRYAAVEYGISCFCGRSFGRYSISTDCNLKCGGNDIDICGGYLSHTVLDTNFYELVPDTTTLPTTTPESTSIQSTTETITAEISTAETSTTESITTKSSTTEPITTEPSTTEKSSAESITTESTTTDKPPANCRYTQMGQEYLGHLSVGSNKNNCLSWSLAGNTGYLPFYQTFPDGSAEAAKNYCRNPSDYDRGPWCYTNISRKNTIYSYCDVPFCRPTTCRFNADGSEYVGLKSTTSSGRTCQHWNLLTELLSLKNIIIIFSDGNVLDAKNYCRNPNGDPNGPWCYVPDGLLSYSVEYCDIPFCPLVTTIIKGVDHLVDDFLDSKILDGIGGLIG